MPGLIAVGRSPRGSVALEELHRALVFLGGGGPSIGESASAAAADAAEVPGVEDVGDVVDGLARLAAQVPAAREAGAVGPGQDVARPVAVSYTHLRAHETP